MNKRILILYGSETGQAEAISQQIYDQCRQQLEVLFDQFDIGLERHCLNADQQQFNLQNEQTVIFVVSTTGEGEPPQNADKFYRRYRRRTVDKNLLSNLWYTLLALGDSNYERFANFGKELDKRLRELSAKQFYKTGFADDGIGLEIGVEPWIEGLFPAILNHFNVFSVANVPIVESKEVKTIDPIMASNHSYPIMESNETLSQLKQLTLPLISSKFQSFKIKIYETLPEEYSVGNQTEFYFKSLPVMDTKIFDSSLIDIRLLTQKFVSKDISSLNENKTIIEATFAINDSECVDYEPGDSFGFIVGNCDPEVQQLIECLDLTDKQDFYCEVISQELFPHLPKVSKVYDLLKYYLEIRSVPKKSCLRHFADFCGDPSQERRLLELSSREGDEEYNRFIRKDCVGILELLQIFDSCRPPLEVVLANCSPFVPRYYSVINAQNPNNKNQFRILFSLINFEEKNMRKGSQLMGVFTGSLYRMLDNFPIEEDVTNRLAQLSLQSNERGFKLFKRKNLFFKLPKDCNTPVIMVGPGTGVAPFLGFLEQRRLNSDEGIKSSADWWLFYGCRNSKLDFIYEKELKDYLADKVLTQLFVCFSRETQNPSEDKYVQQLIIKESKGIYQLIESQKAVVYVCGDIKAMTSDIFNAFVKVVEECGQQSRENAVKYVRNLQTEKRYLQDIWS